MKEVAIERREEMKCSAKTCHRQAGFECADNLRPTLERQGFPACARHGLLWYRQGRGSIWLFPLEPIESQSLTEAEIVAAVEASGEAPLPQRG